jgi:hypothetical protein
LAAVQRSSKVLGTAARINALNFENELEEMARKFQTRKAQFLQEASHFV